MSQTVNFASQLTKKRSQLDRRDKQVLIQTSIVFGIVALISVGIMISRAYFDVSQQKSEKKYDDLVKVITTQKQHEIEYAQYVKQVNIISDLFANRQAKQEAFARFRFLFGNGVMITGLTYSVNENALGFQLKADTIFVLEQVLDRLLQADIVAQYPKIKKESIMRLEDGAYRMKITVMLDKATV